MELWIKRRLLLYSAKSLMASAFSEIYSNPFFRWTNFLLCNSFDARISSSVETVCCPSSADFFLLVILSIMFYLLLSSFLNLLWLTFGFTIRFILWLSDKLLCIRNLFYLNVPVFLKYVDEAYILSCVLASSSEDLLAHVGSTSRDVNLSTYFSCNCSGLDGLGGWMRGMLLKSMLVCCCDW